MKYIHIYGLVCVCIHVHMYTHESIHILIVYSFPDHTKNIFSLLYVRSFRKLRQINTVIFTVFGLASKQ